MTVATKLNIKPGHTVCVLHAPDGVDLELSEGMRVSDDAATADAVVCFIQSRADLEQRAEPALAAARRDALAWIAYPKSGHLGADLNRDSLAELVTGKGVRPVRQIAVDAVWSALRFRPA